MAPRRGRKLRIRNSRRVSQRMKRRLPGVVMGSVKGQGWTRKECSRLEFKYRSRINKANQQRIVPNSCDLPKFRFHKIEWWWAVAFWIWNPSKRSTMTVADIDALVFKLFVLGAPRDTRLNYFCISIILGMLLMFSDSGSWIGKLYVHNRSFLILQAQEFIQVVLMVGWTNGLYDLAQVRWEADKRRECRKCKSKTTRKTDIMTYQTFIQSQMNSVQVTH